MKENIKEDPTLARMTAAEAWLKNYHDDTLGYKQEDLISAFIAGAKWREKCLGKPQDILFRAIDTKTKEWVTGYFAVHHVPDLGPHNEVYGYENYPCIFNDQNRGEESYWHNIDINSLEVIIKDKDEDTQLKLF